ncbi:transglycosylase SLT domain-containing protein [Clostridium sp.]|uniref:transglycosylase SLT domain-containing protein n=1 Tax=Clostridium sp. TaxID=1506 RepID=UPI003464696C
MKKIFTSLFIILLVVGVTFAIGSRLLYPLKHENHIVKYSDKYKVDPYILASLIHKESNYRSDGYDSSKLNGIIKISDETALKLSKELNLKEFKPKDITKPEIGIEMMAYLLSKSEKNSNLQEYLKPFILRNKDKSNDEIKEYSNDVLKSKSWYKVFHYNLKNYI